MYYTNKKTELENKILSLRKIIKNIYDGVYTAYRNTSCNTGNDKRFHDKEYVEYLILCDIQELEEQITEIEKFVLLESHNIEFANCGDILLIKEIETICGKTYESWVNASNWDIKDFKNC